MKKKNLKKTSFIFALFLAVFLVFSGTNSYAASLGQQLTMPEDGWKRYDPDTVAKHVGTWLLTNNKDGRVFTGGSVRYTKTNGDYLTFKFKGSKFRLIAETNPEYSKAVEVDIDGNIEYFSEYNDTKYVSQVLVYEKLGLSDTVHEVIIKKNDALYMHVDAIDIDADGTLVDIDTPIPPIDPTEPDEPSNPEPEPEEPTTPEQPSGNRAILVVTMTTGLEKEFDLSMKEVNDFIDWYEAKQAGSGKASYAIDKHDNNKGPFSSRKDYILFDRMLTFEVSEYNQ
ncbi:bacterial surface protein [Paenibacillus macerans]|uniref:bacterial surface protein n=1 Tax=Paenibacillus macerans TaxID=44252 RepID=UPI0022E2D4DB|nr:bacterial surface protein [Paenibacillus macerans]